MKHLPGIPALFLIVSISLVMTDVLAENGHGSSELDTVSLDSNIDAEADQLEFMPGTDLLNCRGNVRISYGSMIIQADELVVNTRTHDLEASGNVTFTDGALVWEGGAVHGNLDAKDLTFGAFHSTLSPWYLTGAGIERTIAGEYHGSNFSLSTCDRLFTGQPHWRMTGRRIIYFPDGSFKAVHVVYRFGNLPVFYFPVIWGQTRRKFRNIQFSAGHTGEFGTIITVGKQWQVGEQMHGQSGLTYRSRRGLAGYTETDVTTASSSTVADIYGMDDTDPEFDSRVGSQKFSRRWRVENMRYRLNLRHRQDVADGNAVLRLNLDYVSDNDLLYEFFRKRFRTNPQPTTFFDARYDVAGVGLALNYRPRINEFESVVERLPEVRAVVTRRPLGATGLLFAGETSYSSMHMNWRDYDLPRPAVPVELKDYSADRFDAVSFLYRPFDIGWLRLTPRAGGRFSYYSNSSAAKVTTNQLNSNFLADDADSEPFDRTPIFNYDDRGGSRSRFAGEVGLELSARFLGPWRSGRRHHVMPFLNYTYIPEPTVSNAHLYFFDEIDRIEESNFARLGAQQSWQVAGDDGYRDVVRLRNYVDVHLSRGDERCVPGDFGTELQVAPSEDLRLDTKVLIDSDGGGVDAFHAGATLRKDRITTQVGYFYRRDFISRYTYSMGSQLDQVVNAGFLPVALAGNHNLRCSFALPLSPKSSLGIQYFLDLEGDRVGRQVYEYSRTLHCWVGAIRLQQDAKDLSVLLILYLKAFPTFRLDAGS